MRFTISSPRLGDVAQFRFTQDAIVFCIEAVKNNCDDWVVTDEVGDSGTVVEFIAEYQ